MDHHRNPSHEPYPDTNTRSIYLGSTRLAHEHLVAQSQVVLRLGRILMKSGASAYRIKASMAFGEGCGVEGASRAGDLH